MFRYDGFDISLEEAATRIREGELELRKVPGTSEPIPVLEQALGKSFKSVSFNLSKLLTSLK